MRSSFYNPRRVRSLAIDLSLFMFILGAVACQGSVFDELIQFGGKHTPIAEPPSIANLDNVLVTGELNGGSSACTVWDVTHKLTALFDAIHRGNPNVVNEFFRGQDEFAFEWYSMSAVVANNPPKDNFVTHHLDELDTYFKNRFRKHEYIHLASVQFHGFRGSLVDFEVIKFTRSADDLQFGGRTAQYTGYGKGAFDCTTQTFVVLRLVTDVP